MSRILSIDYGRRRTGIAVTDPAQIIATGLCTVATHELQDFLKRYVAGEEVERFVLGLPVQTNGEASENQARVRRFAAWLEQTYPDKPVVLWDERFTSTLAHRTMLEAGLKRKDRQNKALVDEVAATIILQSWMESRR